MPEVETLDQPSSELLSARDVVRLRLLQDILHAKIEPLPTEQHPLTEPDVMKRYEQGSRMPVRMALAVLAGEGLFRQRARYGYWLVQYDLHDIEQILRMRAGIEAMVAAALCKGRIASEETAPDESARSRRSFWTQGLRYHDRMGSLVNDARDNGVERKLEAKFGDADTQFHASLARAAGYDIAARHIVEWRNQVRIFRLQRELQYDSGALDAVHSEHSDVVEAISNADETSAADLSRSHVERVLTRAQSLVAEYA
jgi:DNA-binding GntR family transcriptional regulator